MEPTIRYQAAILQNDHVLMLKVWDHAFSGRTFWVIPGGQRLPDETEEECVLRETREETHLEVVIDHLLLNEAEIPEAMYQWAKTYACRISSGDPQPGIEPEVDTADRSSIMEVRWFDLHDPESWDPLALSDRITNWKLQRIREALGYAAGDAMV